MDSAQELIVAHCGLVCSCCGAHRRGKCPGCASQDSIFHRCPVRRCSEGRGQSTCAECAAHPELKGCRTLNRSVCGLVGMMLRPGRMANLEYIRQRGLERFVYAATHLTEDKREPAKTG